LPDDKPDYTLAGILKSILISRGDPQKKFAVTLPVIEVDYSEEYRLLSTKQLDIISFLKDSIMDLQNYDGLNPDNIKRLKKQHLECISESVRAGLAWHPLVSELLVTHKGLGNKEILRHIKRGFEKSVNRCLKHDDIQFKNYLDKIEEYRNSGKTWKEIRRILMKRKIIGNISWQALRKKVAKYAPYILPDTDFVITEDMQHLITEEILNRMKELWRELYANGRKSQYRQEVKKFFNKQ
jgi:hypothetical protein